MKKHAIISVSDKSNLNTIVSFLLSKNYTILSTGGTFNYIKTNFPNLLDSELVQVSEFTGFPEVLGGRVKTLHPDIYSGILYDSKFNESVKAIIDVVVVNLYPFEQVIQSNDCTLDNAIENIDIGGVSLIRAAAKNFKNIKLLVDSNDYELCITNFENIDFWKNMAIKGFKQVTNYDASITNYFNNDIVFRCYEKQKSLKYGCNPYQGNASILKLDNVSYPFDILNGAPGYINVIDALHSWSLVSEVKDALGKTCAASFKHNAPAGVAIATGDLYFDSLSHEAYYKARNADPVSSFGDFIAIKDVVDLSTAQYLSKEVSDGIIADGYTNEALEILKKKKNGNFIILRGSEINYKDIEYREICGTVIAQNKNTETLKLDDSNLSTLKLEEKFNAILATITLKYTPSNSISIATEGVVVGIGAGQQNRVDCIRIAGEKFHLWQLRKHPKVQNLLTLFNENTKRTTKINAITSFIRNDFTSRELELWKLNFSENNLNNIDFLTNEDKLLFLHINSNKDVTLSSDAFMPFRDNIDTCYKYNIKNIIQPGGSVADNEVIEACDEYNIKMIFTGKRFFLH